MRARLVACLLLIGAVLAGLQVPTAVAASDPRIVVTDVDVPAPGLLTAHVRSNLPMVGTQVFDPQGRKLSVWSALDFDGDRATVELETWGLEPGGEYVLKVSNCPRWRDECGTTRVTFVPQDVVPTIVLSEDRHLTGAEQGTVSVDHPYGGGTWEAVVGGHVQPLRADGAEEELRLFRSGLEVHVQQCGIVCRPVGPSAVYTVDKGGDVTASSVAAAVHPDDTAAADTRLSLETGVSAAALHFEGVATTRSDGVLTSLPVSADLLSDEAGTAVLPVDLTHSPDGITHLLGTLTHPGADGPVTRWVLTGALADVDRAAPSFWSAEIDRHSLFPALDGYRDRVSVRVQQKSEPATTGGDRHTVSFIARTAGPTIIRPLRAEGGYSTASWDGTVDGEPAPEGRYDVRIDSIDLAGHATSVPLGSLRLDHRELTAVRRSFVVAATPTVYHRVGGRCARVRLGAAGWDRGLAYRVGTCQSAAEAISEHRVRRVPRGWVGGRLTLSTFGRSAHGYRSTEGAMMMVMDDDQDVVQRAGLPRRMAWKESRSYDSDRLLDGRGRLHWQIFAGYDTRHDIKGFRLRFDGTALR